MHWSDGQGMRLLFGYLGGGPEEVRDSRDRRSAADDHRHSADVLERIRGVELALEITAARVEVGRAGDTPVLVAEDLVVQCAGVALFARS